MALPKEQRCPRCTRPVIRLTHYRGEAMSLEVAPVVYMCDQAEPPTVRPIPPINPNGYLVSHEPFCRPKPGRKPKGAEQLP